MTHHFYAQGKKSTKLSGLANFTLGVAGATVWFFTAAELFAMGGILFVALGVLMCLWGAACIPLAQLGWRQLTA